MFHSVSITVCVQGKQLHTFDDLGRWWVRVPMAQEVKAEQADSDESELRLVILYNLVDHSAVEFDAAPGDSIKIVRDMLVIEHEKPEIRSWGAATGPEPLVNHQP